MEASIGNPVGANQKVSDFRTFKTDDGELIRSGAEDYVNLLTSAAVAKGEVVQLVVPTATQAVTVIKAATAVDQRLIVGVAEHAAAINTVLKICRAGVTELFVNAQTVAFGDNILKPGTNAGEATCSAADPDATTVVGSVLGVVLAAKSAANLAPAFINNV